MADRATRDENRVVSHLAQNLLGTSVVGVTGRDLTNANPLDVSVVDSSGNQITSFTLPVTTGGYTIYRNLDVQSTGVNIKNTAGQVYGWYFANNASSVRYVKLYNKATAPTVGTDTPLLTIPIPANSAANVAFPGGIPFSNGIGIGGVTGVADNNSSAPTANDIIGNVLYY